MLISILILTLAFLWLFIETKCLTIRLTGDCRIELDNELFLDIEKEFDNSDCVYLSDYQEQFERVLKEHPEDCAYQTWLDKRYSAKYKPYKDIDYETQRYKSWEEMELKRNYQSFSQRRMSIGDIAISKIVNKVGDAY